MTFYQRLWIGLLVAELAGGCGVQDSTQPPVGSISVGARKDDLTGSLPPGKAKTVPVTHK
jgi:hypothetical protein